MLFRRRLMKQAGGNSGGSYTFSFVANFENNNLKNAMTCNASSSSPTVSTYGIGFCGEYRKDGATYSEQYAELTDVVKMTMTIVTPSNVEYTYVCDNILTYSTGVASSEKSGMAFDIRIEHSSSSSNTPFDFSNDVYAGERQETSYITNVSPNAGGSTFGIETSMSSMNGGFARRLYCSQPLENGDYTFTLTFEGIMPPYIRIRNFAYSTSTTENKTTYNASVGNHSKVSGIEGDSIFEDYMYKNGGSI